MEQLSDSQIFYLARHEVQRGQRLASATFLLAEAAEGLATNAHAEGWGQRPDVQALGHALEELRSALAG